jgi:Uncharacterised nucleotidyltransferase
MNTFRPEVRLLLDCARTCLDAEGARRIKSLVSKDIEWAYLVCMARGHGVMRLIYRTLNSTCSDAVPKLTLEELREHFYANAGRNLFLAKELIKLLHLFSDHEISAIPYKGPVLATSLYGNLALREFGDLDVLVREREYQTAQHLLSAQGYRLMKEFNWESTLVHDSGTFAVDLHQEMTAREFSSPLDFEYLSRRVGRVTVTGAEVPTLSPGDTLLMLAIQITKDSGSRYFQLAKICDMAELLRAYPHLDFSQVLRQAKRLGSERMLLYSLRLANNLLGAVLSQEIVREMRFHRAIEGLVECARQQLFDGGNRTVDDQPTIDQFRWLVRERLRDKLYPYYLRYVTDVVVPCELDRRLLPLRRELSFLYYLIRPVRLIGKYGLLQMRRTTGLYRHDQETPVVAGGSENKALRLKQSDATTINEETF